MTTLELDRTLIRHDSPAETAAHRRSLSDRLPLADLITAGVIAGAAATIAFTNIAGAPGYQDDEGIYAAQAVAVQNGSLAPYTYWYDHPPFGWIQLAILGWPFAMAGIGDGSAVSAMRAVIALYFVANSVLIFLISRRLRLALPFAILASGVFVLSPLSLELGRQVYLDTVGMPWLLLAFYLALSPRQGLWHHAGAGLGFAVAVLSKITASIFGPALLVAMIDRPAWKGRAFSIVAFLTIGGLALMFLPIMALLRGELLSGPGHVSLEDGLLYQFASRAGSGYLWEAGSARGELVQGWLGIDGFLVIAGGIAALLCVGSRRTRWITVAVISFFLPVLVGTGYLPAMYIIGGIPFLCLAIGSATDLVWRVSMRFARRHLPGSKYATPIALAGVLAAVLMPIPYAQWVDRDTRLLNADANADWRATLAWVQQNVPRDDDIVVPFSLWQAVDESGWNDPWSVIALEKVDLDSDFAAAHPDGWHELEWIVDGPTVEPTIRYLGLSEVQLAYDHSHVVAEFGDWRIRRVDAG